MLYYTSFQGSTMLTGPGVLQWKKIILEPSVFIPRGGHSRTFQLEGMSVRHKGLHSEAFAPIFPDCFTSSAAQYGHQSSWKKDKKDFPGLVQSYLLPWKNPEDRRENCPRSVTWCLLTHSPTWLTSFPSRLTNAFCCFCCGCLGYQGAKYEGNIALLLHMLDVWKPRAPQLWPSPAQIARWPEVNQSEN